jgi:hypothetical protein
MSGSVFDHIVRSYEVRSTERTIVLRTESRDVSPPDLAEVRFSGVEAHQFRDDVAGSVLLEVVCVPLERIVSQHRAEIAASRRSTGWTWAEDLDTAADALRALGLQGFEVRATRGLSGWVLARDSFIVPQPRLLDPLPPSERGVYAMAPPDCARERLDGDGILVTFDDGRQLEITLAAVPEDGVLLRSGFASPGSPPGTRGAEDRDPSVYACIVLHPGAGNVLHVTVEARSSTDGSWVAGDVEGERAAGKSCHLLGARPPSALHTGDFLFDLGHGRAIQLATTSMPSRPGRIALRSGFPPTRREIEEVRRSGHHISTSLALSFGGVNVAQVRASPPYRAKAIERPARED